MGKSWLDLIKITFWVANFLLQKWFSKKPYNYFDWFCNLFFVWFKLFYNNWMSCDAWKYYIDAWNINKLPDTIFSKGGSFFKFLLICGGIRINYFELNINSTCSAIQLFFLMKNRNFLTVHFKSSFKTDSKIPKKSTQNSKSVE